MKGFIEGPKYMGGVVLKWFRYIGIGSCTILTSKITVLVLVVCLIIGLTQISFGIESNKGGSEQEVFSDSDELDINYYYDEVKQNDYGNGTAITDMIECYQKGSDLSEVSSDVIKVVNELDSLYDSNSKYFSFLYQDLFSGFTVSYNENGSIFTASTIKAPAMIYIYEMASEGKIDLNEKLVYTSNFYHDGSGVLKNKKYNTEYTIEELVQYTIYESDNIAYKMLNKRFGQDNIRDFWRTKGTKNIFELSTIWGNTSAYDAMIYMKELYEFSKKNEEYGSKLLEHFKKAKWKMITDKDGEFNTANKGGWSNQAIHDVAIVFDENPYILVVMSNLGKGGYNYLFNETSRLVGELHDNYWKYKVALCSNIKMY